MFVDVLKYASTNAALDVRNVKLLKRDRPRYRHRI